MWRRRLPPLRWKSSLAAFGNYVGKLPVRALYSARPPRDAAVVA
ncbi:MAG: hypothetical protein WB868_14040 [Xanthobacteraceae bacterium]